MKIRSLSFIPKNHVPNGHTRSVRGGGGFPLFNFGDINNCYYLLRTHYKLQAQVKRFAYFTAFNRC